MIQKGMFIMKKTPTNKLAKILLVMFLSCFVFFVLNAVLPSETLLGLTVSADELPFIPINEVKNTSTLSVETVKSGNPVTVVCSGKGGTGIYTYAVYYKQASQSSWICKQDYSTNSEVTIKPAKATDYEICVKVKDSRNTVVDKTFSLRVYSSLKNESVVSESVKLGDNIEIQAKASGGLGTYTYAVFYKRAEQTSWICKQDYSANSEITIKPAKATDYEICVKVKDERSAVVKKRFTVNVLPPLKNESVISAENIVCGDKVTVQARSAGSLGDVVYAIYYKKASQTSWICKQNYSTNSEVTIKPAKATDYEICVKVKDERGVVVKKYFTVNVLPPLENESVVSESVKLGDNIDIHAKASGGLGAYTYAVYYKRADKTSWTCQQNYSTNSDITIKPAKATDYEICVKVKDSRGKVSKKYFNVTVY